MRDKFEDRHRVKTEEKQEYANLHTTLPLASGKQGGKQETDSSSQLSGTSCRILDSGWNNRDNAFLLPKPSCYWDSDDSSNKLMTRCKCIKPNHHKQGNF